jgi:hypothetical protein
VDGSTLVYKLAGTVADFEMLTYFPGRQFDPVISVSSDGEDYHQVRSDVETHYNGPGDYGYWKAAVYRIRELGGKAKFIRIRLAGDTQISRTAISYNP